MMKCPKCGKDMQTGFLQTDKLVVFNKIKRKIFLKPTDEDDIMIANKAFTGTDFPGFVCKECGLVVFDYKNGTLRL